MNLRPGTPEDLPLLVQVDLEDEGVTPGYREGWGDEDFVVHRENMAAYLRDRDKGAIVAFAPNEPSIGLLMWRIRNLKNERLESWDVFSQIRGVWPPTGIVCEIFQLWVDPRFRRQGIGSALKLALDDVARKQGAELIYTHTEERNLHVIDLNIKLGYREVRRGTIWDDVIRVSLVKDLTARSIYGCIEHDH
ncbi:MAG: GNAT family N-acetyltransferase [Fimbriimonas sp.]|nr:GNAT family N-acetyltransferase [Fimbriimonas sp.]